MALSRTRGSSDLRSAERVERTPETLHIWATSGEISLRRMKRAEILNLIVGELPQNRRLSGLKASRVPKRASLLDQNLHFANGILAKNQSPPQLSPSKLPKEKRGWVETRNDHSQEPALALMKNSVLAVATTPEGLARRAIIFSKRP